MKDARLQLRLDAKLKKQAEQVAKRRRTTLSAMATQYLQQVVDADRVERLANTTDGEAPQI